jgi:hypothetical protein
VNLSSLDLKGLFAILATMAGTGTNGTGTNTDGQSTVGVSSAEPSYVMNLGSVTFMG